MGETTLEDAPLAICEELSNPRSFSGSIQHLTN